MKSAKWAVSFASFLSLMVFASLAFGDLDGGPEAVPALPAWGAPLLGLALVATAMMLLKRPRARLPE
jgi:hypothetical protein